MMPEYSAQEIFNKVASHLMKMNKRSGRSNTISNNVGMFQCMYKDDTGNKCAIGCLIPDELYQNSYEGRTVYWLIRLNPEFAPWKCHIPLLVALQHAHDFLRFWEGDSMKLNLHNIASAHNLDYSILEQY